MVGTAHSRVICDGGCSGEVAAPKTAAKTSAAKKRPAAVKEANEEGEARSTSGKPPKLTKPDIGPEREAFRKQAKERRKKGDSEEKRGGTTNAGRDEWNWRLVEMGTEISGGVLTFADWSDTRFTETFMKNHVVHDDVPHPNLVRPQLEKQIGVCPCRSAASSLDVSMSGPLIWSVTWVWVRRSDIESQGRICENQARAAGSNWCRCFNVVSLPLSLESCRCRAPLMRRGVTWVWLGAATTSTKSGRTTVQRKPFNPTEWQDPKSHSTSSGAGVATSFPFPCRFDSCCCRAPRSGHV